MTSALFDELLYFFVDKKTVDLSESDALRIKVNYPLYLVDNAYFRKRAKTTCSRRRFTRT